jgi:hypothetical protein
VTSKEGRKRLMMVANDVVELFPAMKEVNTGKWVEKQVLNSPIVVKGVKFREVARYVAGGRKLCGDLSEVENVLPWRRKSGKGGKAPGMQNPVMKGKKSGLDNVWQFPDDKPTPRWPGLASLCSGRTSCTSSEEKSISRLRVGQLVPAVQWLQAV